ncbi:oligosaccharide repeat unit polymerase [Shewanella xiamenensis]|uniref:Oligosaccharide repeat unit polymerase n=1 Tax=Shewanella xiamenensis TaxID=332186 RepID=A0AAW6QTK0_9GAMM|nr:O-antigen ligase [Shewanella xiamenensis]MDG5899117.1 oligosaccharide repeat unit polymerase [Shewanella xiamenensis]
MHHGVFIICFSWWLFWYLVSAIGISGMPSLSLNAHLIYIIFFLSLIVGYLSALVCRKPHTRVDISNHSVDYHVPVLYRVLILLCFLFLSFAAYSAGALTTGFAEYFLLRRGEFSEEIVTGSGLIDAIIKVFTLPILFAIFVNFLSLKLVGVKVSKINWFMLLSCIFIFSYTFQVNYPIIFCFILYFVSIFVSKDLSLKSFIYLFILCFIIMAAAVNRYGSFDFISIIMHYPVTYFSLSFPFFDYHLSQSDGLLFDHTYGESFLGYLTIYPVLLFKITGFPSDYYIPASFENISYNSQCVYLGHKCYNAFGSIIFSFFRDFGYVGVMMGAAFIGFLISYLNIKKRTSLFMKGIFLYVSSSFVNGIMVSPFDLPYFWNVMVLLFLFNVRLFPVKRSFDEA